VHLPPSCSFENAKAEKAEAAFAAGQQAEAVDRYSHAIELASCSAVLHRSHAFELIKYTEIGAAGFETEKREV